ncbi:MAG TPA: rod shape-determining protein RodA [Solirubrobacteraceae bacterium]|jgi:rod shape determining protein RodA
MSATPIQPGDEVAVARPRIMLRLDPLLLLGALGLVACSLITLRNAIHNTGLMDRQAIYAGLGLIIVLILSRIDYSRLREYKLGLFGAMVALNLVVYAMPPIAGARRWIPLPFMEFQSSEFGKLLVLVALAAFAVDRSRRLDERRTTARIMLLALVAAMLVIPQPDLGTGMVYVAIGFSVLFFAGTPWKQLTGLLILFVAALTFALAAAPALGLHPLSHYQEQRLVGFLNPSSDPRGATYNIHQSLIAIGSGQKTGRGVNATQTTQGFLSANDTDFVFAAVGETYGFVGAAVVLSLYALLIWRTLRILTMAKNLYGTLIAGGILAMLMFQVFINVGMTIGIMPITGVPLPLLSYGGSSVIVTFIAIGLLQSIYIQARIASTGKPRALLS